VDHVRLFRNHPEIRWKYRVHEQILPAIRRQQGEIRWTDVVIHHVGYQDPSLRQKKLERDIRLLLLENDEKPDDPFTLFNMGSVFLELGKPTDALEKLRGSLVRSQPGDSIVRKLYALITHCHRQLGQKTEALAACSKGRAFYPDDTELLFQESLVRREHGDLAGAETSLIRLLHSSDGAHFASVDAGLRGYKARHNLATIYQEQGRLAEAEAQWRTAAAEAPGFSPAWLGIAEICLAERRWTDLEQTLQRLAANAGSEMEEAGLRARAHLARREFTNARQLLEETTSRFPKALWPRRILSHVLLQEGLDWEAAEQALKSILELAPDDAEARRNLSLLVQQMAVGIPQSSPKSDSPPTKEQDPATESVPCERGPAEKRVALARQHQDQRDLASALSDLGAVYLRQAEAGSAVPVLEEALAISRQLGDRNAECDVLGSLGLCLLVLGRSHDACGLFEQEHSFARAAGNRFAEKLALEHRSQAAGVVYDVVGARAYAEQASELGRALNIVIGPVPNEPPGPPEPELKTQTAGLLRMGLSAAKAAAGFVASGFKTASREVQQQRLQVCSTCEHSTGLRCRLCGCFTAAKARLPLERCPIDKWQEQGPVGRAAATNPTGLPSIVIS
jgi:tetratricopeptide (TPR) repeat protein